MCLNFFIINLEMYCLCIVIYRYIASFMSLFLLIFAIVYADCPFFIDCQRPLIGVIRYSNGCIASVVGNIYRKLSLTMYL